MSENKLNDIIGTSLEKIRALADGETVIGNPINTPNGTTIIPVSRVSMGFASGGLDYNGKKAATAAQNFGGGGGMQGVRRGVRTPARHIQPRGRPARGVARGRSRGGSGACGGEVDRG